MRAKSFEGQLHQAPMKPGARPTSEHRLDQWTSKPKCPQSARHVDPIGSSEWLDERVVIGVGGCDLGVVLDHPFDLSDPCRQTMDGEVLTCERDGRRDVIERLVGPDPEVVEDRGGRELLEVDTAFHDGRTQVHDAVYMVPIGDEVVPQLRRVIVQNLINRRDASQEAGSGERLYHDHANRFTNSSAFSATSRQPASMVSACPRPGILTISVTPVLLVCFLYAAFAIAQGTVWSESAETISIGPRSGFFVSTVSSDHGFRFAAAAWKSGSPAPGTE